MLEVLVTLLMLFTFAAAAIAFDGLMHKNCAGTRCAVCQEEENA